MKAHHHQAAGPGTARYRCAQAATSPLDVEALDRALAQFIARRLGPAMKPGAWTRSATSPSAARALTLRVRLFADDRDVKHIERLSDRFILAFFSASVGLVAVLLVALPAKTITIHGADVGQ